MARDRDSEGRARSSRGRDALGRPLPRGVEGIPRIPDDLNLPPTETLRYAQELLDAGLAFNAHEVLEAAWKQCPESERSLWQGLAQVAVAITHLQRENPKGARILLGRAYGRLSVLDEAPYGIDLGAIVEYIEQTKSLITEDPAHSSGVTGFALNFSLLGT